MGGAMFIVAIGVLVLLFGGEPDLADATREVVMTHGELQMTPYILAFFAAFVFIFLKAWQQLNVVHKQYLWILPTSMCMAVCEVYVIATTARNGWGWLVLWIGLGSGLGAMASMYLHGRMTGK